MILSETEVRERLESPLNLLNRLRKVTNGNSHIPSLPPKIGDIVPNIDEKISVSSTKSKALKIMDLAMVELEKRVIEVEKPRELSTIISDMNKVVSAQEQKAGGDNNIGQIIIYSPRVVSEEVFEVARVVNE